MWKQHPNIARKWAHKYGSNSMDSKTLKKAAKKRLTQNEKSKK